MRRHLTRSRRRSWSGLSLAGAMALALVVAGCGGGEQSAEDVPEVEAADDEAERADQPEPSEDAASEQEAVVNLVATVAPIADLVGQVGGDRVDVEPLVPAGGDAHTYEPRPQDVVMLTEADAFFGIGLGLNDGALRLAEENLEGDAPIFLLGEAALADADLVFDHTHDHDEGGHSHGDEGGHSHGEDEGHSHGEEEAGHSHGEEGAGHSHDDDDGPGANPHVWTSVRNAAALVDAIADALSELDPEGADTYADNAAQYRQELADLDRRIDEATATIPEDNRTLVTYHDAWSYFARDYDLDYATAVQPADFSEPSAAEVRAVIDLIRELDVSVVFGSEVFPTPVLETIAEETGATYVADLSDDVLPGEPDSAEHTYFELMRRNAYAIVDALGGDADDLG